MLNLTGLANRALPRMPDNDLSWIDTEYTLSKLRTNLNRIRTNLGQGHAGPHLYPLAQMDDDHLEPVLEDMKEAVRTGDRHSSFDPWKLLFIHKPGRDRFDLKGGCRPIVVLSHLLANDERMLAALVTKYVDAIDVNGRNEAGRARSPRAQHDPSVHHANSGSSGWRTWPPDSSYVADMMPTLAKVRAIAVHVA